MEDLIVEDGRVVGARVSARRLNAEHRGAQGSSARRRRLRPQRRHAAPVQRRPAERGQVVDRERRRHRRGAADGDATSARRPTCWTRPGGCQWFSSRRRPGAASLGSGRQRPGAIYVDSTGRRFCNESNSYVEVGKAMYANKAVPCWQVFDEGYVGRYVSGANPLKKRPLPEELIEQRRRQAGRHHRRPRAPDRRSRRRARGDDQAVQRIRGQGPRPRLRPRASRPTTTASAIPGTSPTPRSARSTGRRTTRPGCCPPMSGHAEG